MPLLTKYIYSHNNKLFKCYSKLTCTATLALHTSDCNMTRTETHLVRKRTFQTI